MKTIHIAFGADARYAEQLMTTIKSVCYHNSRIYFHLLNRDFPSEWFDELNQTLSLMDSRIGDLKITNGQIGTYRTLPHIASDSTYFRYFIPELIHQERILYLDCDLVNGDLSPLFALDLQNKPLAAVPDIITKFNRPENNPQFNAGVMLIDNAEWRKIDLTRIALDLSDRIIHELPDSDQSILNILFENKWLRLHRNCNYQVGLDWILADQDKAHQIENLLDIVPLIVHYNTAAKPWSNQSPRTRFQDLYSRYRDTDWETIIGRHQV
ncbi:MAG: glycosyltransferase family 8 protein [Neisseria sp.]|nr:glycosyltransferase family 8 protein [Neisseria sp.]